MSIPPLLVALTSVRRSHALTVLAVLLVAPLAGCMDPDLGTGAGTADRDDPSRGNRAGNPFGHPLSTRSVVAASAALAGLDLDASPSGRSVLRLGVNASGIMDHRALVAHEAVVTDAGTGVLVAASESIVLDGPLRYEASAVTLTGAEILHAIESDNFRGIRKNVSETLREALEASDFGRDAFFSDPLVLRTTGPVTVEGTRLVLVTEKAIVELGTSARLESAGAWSATTAVDVVATARAVTIDAPPRATLALVNATGDVVLDDGDRLVPLDGHAAITLGTPTTVTLSPTDGGVRADAEGYAFQVYESGEARIPARLELSFRETSLDLGANDTSRARFTLRNADPDTDAVIYKADVSGAPEGHFDIPRFELLTDIVFRELADHPVTLAAAVAASPALILADAFLVVLDAIFGAPEVPQVVAAGTTFTTDATVTGADAPFEVTLTFEGNFPDASATVLVT